MGQIIDDASGELEDRLSHGRRGERVVSPSPVPAAQKIPA